MNIDLETRERIKRFIRVEIKKNNGMFDRTLKLKLKFLLSRKLKSELPEKWEVNVPYEMLQSEKKSIAKLFNIQEDQMHIKVDKSLIGGFTLQSESKLIDASVNRHITNLVTETI